MLERRLAFVKEKVSIVRLFKELGFDVRDTEREHQVSCPFHDDRHASSRIFPDQDRFWCWTCGKGGDIIWIVQETFKLNFIQAVEWLEKTFDCRYEESGYERRFSEALRRMQEAEKPAAESAEAYWWSRHRLLVDALTAYRQDETVGGVEKRVLDTRLDPWWDELDDVRMDVAFGLVTIEQVRAAFDAVTRVFGLRLYQDFVEELRANPV